MNVKVMFFPIVQHKKQDDQYVTIKMVANQRVVVVVMGAIYARKGDIGSGDSSGAFNESWGQQMAMG